MIIIDLEAKIQKKIKDLEHKIQYDKVLIKQRQEVMRLREERLRKLKEVV